MAISVTHAAVLLLCLSLTRLAQPQNSPHDFLQPHNAARAEVGVRELSWDRTLAAYARSYGERRSCDCALKHSGGPYGENIFRAAPDGGGRGGAMGPRACVLRLRQQHLRSGAALWALHAYHVGVDDEALVRRG
ncbi:hypothetical protein E2562_000218 [Oryza meyeriana var. granulata]|uniref:SCP domain-containing protein n=1 Tax=Oryza meyeriana var. granulata TaxID=110450 RepID=A0A6G1CNF8_9ORYZ|nr:hypothetical protein E2562_000218 [Oryza meyeriana var. granulata]